MESRNLLADTASMMGVELPSCSSCSSSSSSDGGTPRRMTKRQFDRLTMLTTIIGGIITLFFVLLVVFQEAAGVEFIGEMTVSSTSTALQKAGRRDNNYLVDKSSAELSFLASSALVNQSPTLDFVLSRMLQPALIQAALAVTLLHSIPLLHKCSKWLGPYSHSGWTTKHRFVGLTRYLRRRLLPLPIKWRKAPKISTVKRLWGHGKKAVRHLYKKRARYSVASELTNLVPPEPKEQKSVNE